MPFFLARTVVGNPAAWLRKNAAPFRNPLLDAYALVAPAAAGDLVYVAKNEAGCDEVRRTVFVGAEFSLPKALLAGIIDRRQLEVEFPEVFAPAPLGTALLLDEITRMNNEFNGDHPVKG